MTGVEGGSGHPLRPPLYPSERAAPPEIQYFLYSGLTNTARTGPLCQQAGGLAASCQHAGPAWRAHTATRRPARRQPRAHHPHQPGAARYLISIDHAPSAPRPQDGISCCWGQALQPGDKGTGMSYGLQLVSSLTTDSLLIPSQTLQIDVMKGDAPTLMHAFPANLSYAYSNFKLELLVLRTIEATAMMLP